LKHGVNWHSATLTIGGTGVSVANDDKKKKKNK